MTTNETTTPMIDALYPAMELHVHGCADVARSLKQRYSKATRSTIESSETFSGRHLVEALVAVDETWASMFGETAYTESSRENGCWTVTTGHIAPCLAKLIRGSIVFEPVTGRPLLKSLVDEAKAAAKGARPARTPARATKPVSGQVKVLVQLTVTIDVAAFDEAYGTSEAKAIRAAVTSGIANAISEGHILSTSVINVKQW